MVVVVLRNFWSNGPPPIYVVYCLSRDGKYVIRYSVFWTPLDKNFWLLRDGEMVLTGVKSFDLSYEDPRDQNK